VRRRRAACTAVVAIALSACLLVQSAIAARAALPSALDAGRGRVAVAEAPVAVPGPTAPGAKLVRLPQVVWRDERPAAVAAVAVGARPTSVHHVQRARSRAHHLCVDPPEDKPPQL
jgi:hypothetical protein